MNNIVLICRFSCVVHMELVVGNSSQYINPRSLHPPTSPCQTPLHLPTYPCQIPTSPCQITTSMLDLDIPMIDPVTHILLDTTI